VLFLSVSTAVNSLTCGGNDRLDNGRNHRGYRVVRISLYLDHGGAGRARGLANNIRRVKRALPPWQCRLQRFSSSCAPDSWNQYADEHLNDENFPNKGHAAQRIHLR